MLDRVKACLATLAVAAGVGVQPVRATDIKHFALLDDQKQAEVLTAAMHIAIERATYQHPELVEIANNFFFGDEPGTDLASRIVVACMKAAKIAPPQRKSQYEDKQVERLVYDLLQKRLARR